MFTHLNLLSIGEIADLLAQPVPVERKTGMEMPEPSARRKAGVLIPFIREQESWKILYIRRAESVRDPHSGQVAFAGGMWEESDASLAATALREAHEEIGLAPADVELLGELPHHHSLGGIEITPVVATMPWPYSLNPEAAEVAHVFSIPLYWLADPDNYQVEQRGQAVGKSIFYKPYNNEILWGATARMTLSLIAHLTRDAALPEIIGI